MTSSPATRYRHVVRFVLPVLLASIVIPAAGSCRSTPNGAAPPQGANGGSTHAQAPGSASASSSSPTNASAPSADKLPYELDRGCAEDIDDTRPLDAQLDQMGSTCVRGFTRVGSAELRVVDGAESLREAVVHLDAFACLRAAVAAEPRGVVVDAALVDAEGREVENVRSRAPMLVGQSGPVCVRAAGDYKLRVRAAGAAGCKAAVWTASR